MTSCWRRSTWTPPGHPLLLRRSTPALCLQLPSRRFPRRLKRPTTTTARIRTTTTTMAVMAAATAARMIVAVTAVVVTRATPLWPPLDPQAPMVRRLLHGRHTPTYGRGTSPCTPAPFLRDSNARRPTWPRWLPTLPWDSCPGSSRPHLFPLQAGHLEIAWAGTSSSLPTPSAPWRSNHLLPQSRTGWQILEPRTTPPLQLVIFPNLDL
jgi:hypothetical protein